MKRGQPDLMVTFGAEGSTFGTLSGKPVSTSKARNIQSDLFVKPAEDGLFPGMTQTWINLDNSKD